jgi:small-conductance mechanosensitive channel
MTFRRVLVIIFVVALHVTSASIAIAQDVDLPDVSSLADVVRWTGLFFSVAIIVGASLLLRFVQSVADRLATQFTTRRLLIQKIESFTRFFVYFATGAVVVTLSFRIDKTVLTIVGGALAFAIGFAMRDLVAAVIAGVMIMFDRPFQVGDRVTYAGEYGDIIQIGLRSVRMRTLDDNIVTIPNNKILTDVTSSGNYGALDMQVTMDFFIGVDQDIDLAERLVHESILTSRYVFLEKPIKIRLVQIIQDDYVAVRVRGRAYVLDTKYEKAFESDVNKRVMRAFRRHHVKPPAKLHRIDIDHGELAALLQGLRNQDSSPPSAEDEAKAEPRQE